MTSNTSATDTIRADRAMSSPANAVRVAPAIPALVVLGDGVHPATEPGRRGSARRRPAQGGRWMICPLLVARPPRLVEDLGGHLELAHVVEEPRPVQPVELVAARSSSFAIICE